MKTDLKITLFNKHGHFLASIEYTKDSTPLQAMTELKHELDTGTGIWFKQLNPKSIMLEFPNKEDNPVLITK